VRACGGGGGERKKLRVFLGFWASHRDELEADFQQFYGLDLLGDLGVTLSPARAARLAYQLPRSARVWVSVTTDGEDVAHIWTPEYRLLAEIYNAVTWLQWSRTKAAQDNPHSAPHPLVPPESRQKSDAGFTAPADEYLRIMRDIEQGGINTTASCIGGE
jgi:hypothetical protein